MEVIKSLFCVAGFAITAMPAIAEDYVLSTEKTSLIINAQAGRPAYIQYYGSRLAGNAAEQIYAAGQAYWHNSYPTFGIHSGGEKALAVTQADGSMTADLEVVSSALSSTADGELLTVNLRDKVYPLTVTQYFKAYRGTDVITTYTAISNTGKKPLVLHRFASAYIPVKRGDNYVTHTHGTWGAESMLEEEYITNGQKRFANKEGLRNAFGDNASVMVSLNGRATEESGYVIGGVLAWSGNYDIRLNASNTYLDLIAGINEETSHYSLGRNDTLTTPEFAMTYSTEGKGGVSRAFHRWARSYKLCHGSRSRDILLNSWEGVYFNVNQEGMDQMMEDMAGMGGELFVMDDGWFGKKYPRNGGETSLGDWVVCKEKLPGGIEGLTASAAKHGIRFGIWIEPEMTNTKSELFEKHPDWVLSQSNRPLSKGRGGTQVILDLTNPEVQDFVFGVVDNLLTRHPEIAYIKWDANAGIMNYSSRYLPADRQSHLYIDYHLGLGKVLKRIRAKYPDVVMQACASGGGRVNYGLLPYFDEFWTSDDTDALQRIYMQWGVSQFYPAIAMASHVSADRNHQTGRRLPLKFRFDVAMSGRLGMEIQPKNMSDADKTFARRAIAAYKGIRPIVQQGDLYRLVSPYEKRGTAALMYATPEKDKAVLFVYKTEHFINQNIPVIRLSGVDPSKTYRITDLTPADEKKTLGISGKTISGRLLKDAGLSLPLNGEYASIALQLEAVD